MIRQKVFSWLLLFSATLLYAQDSTKKLKLADGSTVPTEDILKALSRECPDVSMTNDLAKSEYTLEARKKTTRSGLRIEHITQFDLTLFDRDGNMFSSGSDTSLNHLMKDLCHAIKTFVSIEVVDTLNLTQSGDTRGDTSGGIVGAVVNSTTGRRTHTDASSIYVVVSGEHALLDCYEHATGCATLAPGKYYGERRGDGIWVSYRMPVTHTPMRNHYKIAGGW